MADPTPEEMLRILEEEQARATAAAQPQGGDPLADALPRAPTVEAEQAAIGRDRARLNAPAQRAAEGDAGGGADGTGRMADFGAMAAQMEQEMRTAASAEREKTANGPMDRMMRGFNTTLANTIGFPVEVVNEALGYAGMSFLEQPGNAMAAVRDGFRRAGIDVKEGALDGWMEKIGGAEVGALLTFVGMRGAAPTLQARVTPQSGTLQRTGAALAEGYTTQPGRMLTTDVAATAAAVPGADAGGSAGGALGKWLGGETGEAVGRAVGEVAGGMTTGVAGGLTAARVANSAVNRATGAAATQTPSSPIIERNADIEAPKYFAEQQIAREKRVVERSIENAIQSVRSRRDAGDAAVHLRERLDEVQEEARRIEGRLWRRVPQRTPVPVDNLKAPAKRMLAQLDTNPEAVPEQLLVRLATLAQKYPNGIPLGKLQQFRTGLLREATAAGGWRAGGTPPNKQLQANLYTMNDKLLEAMEASLQGNPVMQQARAFSRAMNDRFQRGELGDFFARTDSGELRIHPDDTLFKLINKPRGARELVDAMQPMPGPTRRGIPLTKGVRTLEAANDALAARFRQVAQEARTTATYRNPDDATLSEAEAVSKFFHRNRNAMVPLHRAYTDIESTIALVDDQIREMDTIRKSAVAQYAQRDPQKAVAGIVNSPDPAKTARELKRTFGRDQDAHQGFEKLIVETMIARAGPSMINAEKMLQLPKYQRLLREALEPDKYDRFYRIVQTGAALERGEGGGKRSLVQRGSSMFAHLLGLQLGRVLAHTFATGQAGSLSIPARVSSAFRDAVAQSFANRGPSVLFTEAVLDPKWERVLLSKLPSNATEAEKTMAIMRRMVAKGAGARVGLTDLLTEDEGSQP